MRLVVFCQSLASDWNHGNAHFLRGLCSELQAFGHAVDVYEPRDSWSRRNLEIDAGPQATEAYRSVYPALSSRQYDLSTLDLDAVLDGADAVLVHEWNAHELVARIGWRRIRNGTYTLLFHDTHHRAVTDPASMSRYDLAGYDGVLAFGKSLAMEYERHGWARRAWVLHEAADTRVFRPLPGDREGDLIWIGNWGDEERTKELQEFLIEPVDRLGLRSRVHGVRYPAEALARLAAAGIEYERYLPNFHAPEAFSHFSMTVHVPRRPYAEALPGVPTIRVFEALACGIPLVSAPWDDAEHLFRPGEDFLVARNGEEMTRLLAQVRQDAKLRGTLAKNGLRTITARHTCAHRAAELLAILAEVRQESKLEMEAVQ